MKTYLLTEQELVELVGLWRTECFRRGLILSNTERSFPLLIARAIQGYKAMSLECQEGPEWPECMGDREVNIGDPAKTPFSLYRAKHPSHVCKNPQLFEGQEAKLKGFALMDPGNLRELAILNELWHWAIHESKKKAFILAEGDAAESAA
jgi:hypothetical protein